MKLDVVVPVEGSHLRAVVKPGAGCVMVARNGLLRLHHQANTGAINLLEYADRVAVAAFRARDEALTHAVVAVQWDDVLIIGSFDTQARTLTLTQRDALAGWLDTRALAGSETIEIVFGESS